ncbi:MAG: DUF2851 family protein [Dehalococcoidales bacterium]
MPKTSSGSRKSTSHRWQNHRVMPSGSGISEHLLVQAWQQLPGRADLITEEGEPMRLIYPGRENDDQGADLRDAVILSAQRLLKGDIEFHRWSSDWKKHYHHQNPEYNRTILHVVMWRDTEPVTHLQNGEEVPILVLNRHLETAACPQMSSGHATDVFALPCYQVAGSLSMSRIDEILDAAGRERFMAKAAAFQGELSGDTPEQVFYRGIMSALGYSKNKHPFEELARRVPLHRLEAIVRRNLPDDKCLAQQQALLLGTAGLLPSQRGILHHSAANDRWVETLERYWSEYDHDHVMPADIWRLIKVRPNNYPARRLAGISHLVLRHGKRGLLDEITSLISEVKINQVHLALAAAMTVMASGYWKTHHDFGCHSRYIAPALIGSSRAAVIAVNVILPFIFAWSRHNARPELAARSLAIFTAYPKPGTNAIERHMSKQLGRSGVPVNSAQRQQGLIHIHKTFCTQGKCPVCPLGMEAKR